MSKLDEFKVFIKDQKEVLNKIHNGELTWQKVYEIYDIHGPSHSIFKSNKAEESSTRSKTNNQINNALKAFQDIDMDKISDNLQSLQKVLGIFSEFSKGNKNETSHSISKGNYRRYND